LNLKFSDVRTENAGKMHNKEAPKEIELDSSEILNSTNRRIHAEKEIFLIKLVVGKE